MSISNRGGDRSFGLLLLLFPLLSACAVSPPGRAPEVALSEACRRYQTPLAQEFRAWELGPSRLSTEEGSQGTLLPLDQRIVLELRPQVRKRFEAGAKAPTARPKGFRGATSVRVASTGLYKFSIGGSARLQLVQKDGAAILADRKESQRACPTITEVQAFLLEGGRDYVLKIFDSAEPDLDLLISRLEND